MAYTRERHQDGLVSADEGQLYKRALTGPDSRCCYGAVIESRVKYDPVNPHHVTSCVLFILNCTRGQCWGRRLDFELISPESLHAPATRSDKMYKSLFLTFNADAPVNKIHHVENPNAISKPAAHCKILYMNKK